MKRSHLLTIALALACALFLTGVPSIAQDTFDIEDYFILAQDSEWHYTGSGQTGSSPDDDFTWTVLALLKDVGGGILAICIRTLTDEPDDARNMDEDFWYLSPAGELFFYGLHNGQADTGFPVQDVILDDPILIGYRGLKIGDIVEDTGSGSVLLSVPIIGDVTVNGTITSKITYVEFLPYLDTPIGRFYDVLHLILELTGSATVSTPFGPQIIDFPVREAELYLKDGVGMVLQDQDADINDAENQIIDRAQVAGQTVVGEKNAARAWALYD